MPQMMTYTYRHINHVEVMPEGGDLATEQESFEARVKAKYAAIESKPKAAKPHVPPAPALAPAPAPNGSFQVAKGNGIGWWNVVGPNGAQVNEKPLRKAEAEDLAKAKNAEMKAA